MLDMAYYPSGGAYEGRLQTREKCKMDLLVSLCAIVGLQGPAALRVRYPFTRGATVMTDG